MADFRYGEVGVGTPALNSANLRNIVNGLGGLISVTLIAGLVFWGYQLVTRDVSGVPVVRAIEGPMRVAPLDPGGSNAQHQGLAVNTIAAMGAAEAPADRLVLAPKPTAMNGNDPTAAQLLGAQATQAALSGDAASPALNPATGAQAAAPANPDQAALILAALQLVDIDPTPNPNPAPTPTVPAGLNQVAISASVPGISSSMFPQPRPAIFSTRVAPAQPHIEADTSVKSISPADIPPGTRLAQLGAFETADIAKSEWLKISTRFDAFMADKSRVIEQAQSGGKVFYRLRAHGFSDLSDARRFCSTLLAAQANCIPVVTR